MTVAGIDLSTKAVDIVLLDDDTDNAVWHRIPIADKRGWIFAARNVRALPTRSWWEDHGVWLAAIEDPVGRHAHTQKALGGIVGAVVALLPPDLVIVPTRPAEWFGIFTGLAKYPTASAARKTSVRLRCARRGFVPGDDNACDAYAVAWSVRKLNAAAIETA